MAVRLLIVDPSRSDRDTTLRMIPPQVHEVRVAQDAASALTILDEGDVDVVLVEASMTGISGCELVKRIRAREAGSLAYVVVTASRTIPGDLKAAFLAGADDFLRKPFAGDELLARIEGLARVRRWASRLLTTKAFPELIQVADLSTISAWTSVDASMCSDLSDMLGFQLAPVATASPLDGCINIATLPLSLASERTEVCLAVGIDVATAAELAKTIFGRDSVDDDAIKDMLREIANVAAGAFKRVAASEGRTFTTGLPSEVTPEAFRKANVRARRQWVGAVEGSPISLRFELELRVRELSRVRVSALREGMVVAADIKNPSGALLVAIGTRLTETSLTGLTRALGAQAIVDVLEAA